MFWNKLSGISGTPGPLHLLPAFNNGQNPPTVPLKHGHSKKASVSGAYKETTKELVDYACRSSHLSKS